MKCPKGFICITNNILVFLAFLLILAVLFFAILPTIPVKETPRITPTATPPQVVISTPPSPPIVSDLRFSRSPPPLREWNHSSLLCETPLPFYIHTRGLPEEYQSMGIISVKEGESHPLPLYGRRTVVSGNRWNYYTKTDQYNPVSVPIVHSGKNCIEDLGCNEIFTGDKVDIPSLKKSGDVEIYKIGGLKYVHGII